MTELVLENLVKVYPFAKISGLPGARKRARERRRQQMSSPYITNEGVLAVQQFSLELDHGDFLVLLGPSGCGKSSVLRMIAGLETVSLGRIWLDGEDITDLRPEERNIAMIFQEYALYPHLTVYDNIAYSLKNQHMPRHEIQEMVEEIARVLELEDLLGARPRELSGGQQQRVVIGRALVRKPKLFLMDEPFSNLDLSFRSQLRRVVQQVHERLGTTFIYVTHDQQEAFQLGSKIAVMRHGMIEQLGTPRELYNRPANTYVAGFVGVPPMNLLKAKLYQRENQRYVQVLGREYCLPDLPEKKEELSGEKEILLGIRPVHIQPEQGGVEATVQYVEHNGNEETVHLLAGENELTMVIPKTAETERLFRGTPVLIAPRVDCFHLFDKENGARL